MNTPEFPVARGRDPLGEDREGEDGMFVRMITIEGRREQLDEFARIGEKKLLPALRSLDGFGGLLVLAKHRNSKILVVTFWASREAMRAGEEASRWLRAFGAEAAGGEVTSVERYEVVFSGTGRAQETSTLPGSSTPRKAERGEMISERHKQARHPSPRTSALRVRMPTAPIHEANDSLVARADNG